MYIFSNVAYHGDLQRKAEMEQRRQLNENGNSENTSISNVSKTIPNQAPSNPAPLQHPSIGKISDFDPQVNILFYKIKDIFYIGSYE